MSFLQNKLSAPVRGSRLAFGVWDVLAVILVIGVIVVLARSSQGVLAPRSA